MFEESAAGRKDPTFNKRFAPAAFQLLAKFGVSPDAESDVFGEALERMEAGLPDLYKELL